MRIFTLVYYEECNKNVTEGMKKKRKTTHSKNNVSYSKLERFGQLDEAHTIRLQVITSFVSIIGSFRFSSALMNFVNRLHICSTIGYVNFVCYSAQRQKKKQREKKIYNNNKWRETNGQANTDEYRVRICFYVLIQ